MPKIRINVHTNKSKVLKNQKKFFPLRRIKCAYKQIKVLKNQKIFSASRNENTHFPKGVCVTVVVLPPVITPCESKFVVVVVPV